MTLTAYTPESYPGDDATASFAINFTFWDDDDPQAILTVDATEVETVWVRGTHYTITGGAGSTGTLTVITTPTDYTPATGETLTITSKLANTQPTVVQTGGDLSSGAIEQQLDQTVRQIQQEADKIDRAIKLKTSSTESGPTLEDLTGNAAKFLQVNTAEDGYQHATVTSSGTITDPVPVANGGTGSTSAATALTALTAAGTGITNTFTKNQIWSKGADLASASPLVLGTDGNYFDVTGNTSFAAITVAAGGPYMIQFDGTPTMTHSATLDLPGEANITAAAGDRMIFFAQAANDVQVLSYVKADGTAIVVTAAAAQSDQETGTSTTTYVSPGRQQFHQSAVKLWAYVDRSAGTPSLSSPSYNITSVTDGAAAQTTVTIATDFSTAVYVPGAQGISTDGIANVSTVVAGSFVVNMLSSAGAALDTTDFTCWGMGDFA